MVSSGKTPIFFVFLVKAKAFPVKIRRDKYPRKQKEGIYMNATGSPGNLLCEAYIYSFSPWGTILPRAYRDPII